MAFIDSVTSATMRPVGSVVHSPVVQVTAANTCLHLRDVAGLLVEAA